MVNLKAFVRFSNKKDCEYLAALRSAIYAFEGSEKGRQTVQKYLGRGLRGEFNLVNPWARKTFRECVLAEIADLEDPKIFTEGTVMLATFAHRGWVCCDRAYEFDFVKAKQKVRNAFEGMDYIAVFEPAVYPESEWTTNGTTGCLVSFHCTPWSGAPANRNWPVTRRKSLPGSSRWMTTTPKPTRF
jgi:hypothetical protein